MATNDEILIKLKAIDELTPVMLRALQSMEASSAKMASALDQVGSATHRTQENTEGLHGGILTVAAAFELVKGAAELAMQAFEKVEHFFEKAIEESVEAEKSFNRLQGALIATGKYTSELSEELHEYAEAQQKATGASAEAIQNHIAAGVQMGLTVEKAKELDQATRMLAAATGKDLETAFSLMQASLAGHTRGLAKVLPQIAEFGKSQLKQGAAIDLVNGALKAQYELYQGSFAAGLDRAHSSINQVFKEIGNMITQNPVVITALNTFAEVLNHVAESIANANKWVKEHSQQIKEFGTALMYAGGIVATVVAGIALFNTVIPFSIAVWAALTTSVSLYGVAGTIAANATALLDASLAVLLSPITLTIAAVAALTFAFYKWPGLFDVLVGSIKAMIGIALLPMGAALGGLMIGVGALAKALHIDFGASIQSAGEKLIQMNAGLIKNGAAQVQMGVASIKAGKDVKQSNEDIAASHEKSKIAASDHNAAMLALIKTYDGYGYGTLKVREALQGEIEQRNNDLKEFTSYLDAKKRIALSRAQEQEIEVNKIRAGAIAGSGGGEDKSAQAQVAIDAESRKQADLKVLRDKGLLDEDQYNESRLASLQRSQQAELQMDMAFASARAEALGDGPASFSERMTLKKQQYDAETDLAIQKAQERDASEEQIQQLKKDREQAYYASRLDMIKANQQMEVDQANSHKLALADALGNSDQGFALRQQAAQQQYQIEQQGRQQRAQEEGATEAEIQAGNEAQYQDHLARMKQMKLDYIEQDMKRNETLGNNWQVTLDKMRLAQEKDGKLLGTIRGVQQTEEYKGTMTALGNLSSLRNSHSKSAFELGKKAAIAQATISTFMGATEAYASLAAIPFVGPILGAAAAAAAIAAGFVQIQNIQAQKFTGGQAHGGIDEIPQSMSNKTFLLNGGERVLQPEANKDLSEFLESQKSDKGGASGKGNATYNITLNYQGAADKNEARKMAEILVKEIRDMSERGTPIINAKGIVT